MSPQRPACGSLPPLPESGHECHPVVTRPPLPGTLHPHSPSPASPALRRGSQHLPPSLSIFRFGGQGPGLVTAFAQLLEECPAPGVPQWEDSELHLSTPDLIFLRLPAPSPEATAFPPGGFRVVREHPAHSAPHVLLFLPSPTTRSPAPPPEGTSASPAPATPTAAAVPTVPSTTPTVPPEEEDPALSPHLLLPDSLSQLEEFGRQKKWHKRQNKQQRPRQFNDLWVRLEDR